MNERGIIFQGWGVRAILEGRKTQTRRIVKPQAERYNPDMLQPDRVMYPCTAEYPLGDVDRPLSCPYGQPGDTLWVRETWTHANVDLRTPEGCLHRADPMFDDCAPGDISWRWTPSIHMPRWASRLTLRITSVRVQRVQEITEKDAQAEGVGFCCICGGTGAIEVDGSDTGCPLCKQRPYTHRFSTLWDSINGKRAPWASNPWVWAITFEQVTA